MSKPSKDKTQRKTAARPKVEQRLLFAREYIKDLNATQAAIRAGYSEKSAKEQASRLLTNVNVKAEIERLKAERNQRLELSADRVIQELIAIAHSDLTELFEAHDDGQKLSFKGLQNIPVEMRRVVKKLKLKEGHLEIELWDKMQAITLLMKHLGLDQVVLEAPSDDKEMANPVAEAIREAATKAWEGYKDDE